MARNKIEILADISDATRTMAQYKDITSPPDVNDLVKFTEKVEDLATEAATAEMFQEAIFLLIASSKLNRAVAAAMSL